MSAAAGAAQADVEMLLDRLDAVRSAGDDHWTARCPAHQDRRPSLDLRMAHDGKALVYCRGGCRTDEILRALGLEWSTLFPNSPARPVRRSQPETERAQREALLVEADPTLPVIRISAGTGKRAQMRFPESRLAAWLKGREQGLGRPQPKKPKPSVAEVSEITAAKSGAKAPWANGWAKRPAKGH